MNSYNPVSFSQASGMCENRRYIFPAQPYHSLPQIACCYTELIVSPVKTKSTLVKSDDRQKKQKLQYDRQILIFDHEPFVGSLKYEMILEISAYAIIPTALAFAALYFLSLAYQNGPLGLTNILSSLNYMWVIDFSIALSNVLPQVVQTPKSERSRIAVSGLLVATGIFFYLLNENGDIGVCQRL